MVNIELRERSDDFHAQLEGHPEIWECGSTPTLAFGSLIKAHPEAFEIDTIKAYQTSTQELGKNPFKFGVERILWLGKQ